MKPTKANAIKAAAEKNCTLVMDDECVSVIAPHGRRLPAGCHIIDIYYRRGWTMPEVWESILNELDGNTQKCDDPACEWCEAGDVLPYGVRAGNVLTGCRTEMKDE